MRTCVDEILVAQTLEQRQLTQETQRACSLGMLHHKLEEGLAVQGPNGDVGLGDDGGGTGLCSHEHVSIVKSVMLKLATMDVVQARHLIFHKSQQQILTVAERSEVERQSLEKERRKRVMGRNRAA